MIPLLLATAAMLCAADLSDPNSMPFWMSATIALVFLAGAWTLLKWAVVGTISAYEGICEHYMCRANAELGRAVKDRETLTYEVKVRDEKIANLRRENEDLQYHLSCDGVMIGKVTEIVGHFNLEDSSAPETREIREERFRDMVTALRRIKEAVTVDVEGCAKEGR